MPAYPMVRGFMRFYLRVPGMERTVSIRKFSPKPKWILPTHVKKGALSVQGWSSVFRYLHVPRQKYDRQWREPVQEKLTLLGILSGRIPTGHRIIVIEDASETYFRLRTRGSF